MICDNLSVNEGVLYFAGMDVVSLAKKYGTPLYILDENKIRENCNIYKKAFEDNFSDDSMPLYASKANCFKYLYKIMKDENMGIDVVSSGEIYTALKAGFDIKNAYFHSNNKTDEDISYAIKNGIGFFVVDNKEELDVIDREAKKANIVQNILLRLTPGIDVHTYESNITGKVDSKFGQAIETGQAEEITKYALAKENIKLVGFHCHIGSQIFDEDVFERAAIIMLDFINYIRGKYNYEVSKLNLGGGYGVRYVESDLKIDIYKKITEVANVIKNKCKELDMNVPTIHMEPGRSIIADAGIAIYTVGTIKKIPEYKNYVSIDGGMADNPRYILYKAKYTCLLANKMSEKCDFKTSVVGRCCESGDIIAEDVYLPSSVCRYDTLAVLTAGAYHHSLSSNYNKLPKPCTIMIKDEKDFVVIKRQSFDDMIANEC